MRYTREDGCRAWLTYALPRSDALDKILLEFGSAEAIYEKFCRSGGAFLRKWLSSFGIEQLKEHASLDRMHDLLVTMQKHEIGIIAKSAPSFPASLRTIPNAPALLFYQGNLECTMGKCITVVGARKASIQGTEATRTICRELSSSGVSIVSGMAMGIDTAAHQGCIEGGSPTIAVLGCGLDVDYPIDNQALKRQIVKENGLLLSEYPPGVRATKYVFQVRNRIISGLGKALIMMEGRIQSGSMLTVNHALEQGKDVYAYPGIPGTHWAEGAHQLLREGAFYFTSSMDILDDMGWSGENVPNVITQKVQLPSLNDDQRRVFNLLDRGELSFDQLAADSGMDVPALTVSLTMLQMMGLIKALPGKIYCRM